MSKYFNPESYRATGKMSYRVSSSLISDMPVTDKYYMAKKIEIKKREILFFASKVIDMNGFSSLSALFSPQKLT